LEVEVVKKRWRGIKGWPLAIRKKKGNKAETSVQSLLEKTVWSTPWGCLTAKPSVICADSFQSDFVCASRYKGSVAMNYGDSSRTFRSLEAKVVTDTGMMKRIPRERWPIASRVQPHWVPVVHACNPSYMGGQDQEDHGLRPAQANTSQDPIYKIPRAKWNGSKSRWWSACFASVRPWNQTPQSTKKKKSSDPTEYSSIHSLAS
jgi:hypothetical protein